VDAYVGANVDRTVTGPEQALDKLKLELLIGTFVSQSV
jgi:hypothetical protein